MEKEKLYLKYRNTWRIILWLIIVILVFFLFSVFSMQNYSRIMRQNESYVKDNAEQRAAQIDKVLTESLSDIQMIVYWFETTMHATEISPEQLTELQDNTLFDYVEYTNADGVNLAADGRTSYAGDREHYIKGIKGESGISVTFHSRITDETLVNFYTPVYYRGRIVGVMRGIYRAEKRMRELVTDSFFGEIGDTFLCLPDGTVVVGNCDVNRIPENIKNYITMPSYIGKEGAQAVSKAFDTGEPTVFTYITENQMGSGYISKLENNDLFFIQVFPAKITGIMYREAVSAGVYLETSLVVLFLAYIAAIIFLNWQQKKRLLAENTDLNYIIHGIPRLFERFILVDLEKNTYRYLQGSAPRYGGMPAFGKYPAFVTYILDDVYDEEGRRRMERFLDTAFLSGSLGEDIADIWEEYQSKYVKNDWIRFNAVCVQRRNGIPIKVMLAQRNITDEKRDEFERQNVIKQAMETAEKANKAKSTFLFNMSHDIRTPMNAIIGFADLAKKRANDPEAALDYIGKIKRSGDVLLKIINDILDLARIESGKTAVQPVPHSLQDGVDILRDMFAESMKRAGIDFDITMHVKNTYVNCDQLRLNQIIINLLSNAQKFTPSGGKVRCLIEQPGDAVDEKAEYRITVQDTGIGISPEFLPRIFGAFEREHTAAVDGIQGTGLGLSIVKDLVDMMGGSIDVESTPGKGTKFTMQFVFEVAKRDEAALSGNTEYNSADFAGKRILLVEDNELNREIAMEILTEAGFDVVTAEDGAVAVDKVVRSEHGEYDLILMDIQMPNMDGYEAAKAIRALIDPYLSTVPILAMTANAFEEDRRNALACGMNDHIAKPIDVDKLFNTIKRYL